MIDQDRLAPPMGDSTIWISCPPAEVLNHVRSEIRLGAGCDFDWQDRSSIRQDQIFFVVVAGAPDGDNYEGVHEVNLY